MVHVDQIDHIVLTVQNIEKSCSFYAKVLGMEVIEFAGHRKALRFGNQKINLHEVNHEFEPKAQNPKPGAIDLCLLTSQDIDRTMAHLQQHNIQIIEGPVRRTGATGPLVSLYFRDPDGNLLELATPE